MSSERSPVAGGDDAGAPRAGLLDDDARRVRIEADEPHNLGVLALNVLLVRVGWIFKIESVIMPAFLDSIAGAGWLRGLLPVMNRLGQSLAPFLLSRRVTMSVRKRNVLLVSGMGMALPFLVLSAALVGGRASPPPAFAGVFLLLYTFFFASVGMHALSLGTLQGKLVRAQRRGRLLALATMGGAVPAIGLAWWLLPGWLASGASGWSWIFGSTGVCFALAALTAVALREPPDAVHLPRLGVGAQLAGAWGILRDDQAYRRLVVTGVLYTTILMLIPHFQALGRDRLGLMGADLMLWVVVQTAAGGVASVLIGPIADRFGNRLCLRIVGTVAAVVPLAALAIARLGPERGAALYLLVFALLGVTPIGFRVLTNYVLELAPESDHPRYLSLFQLCAAAVVLLSPSVGLLIDVAGYAPAFLAVSAAILTGTALTLRLEEPRRRSSEPRATHADPPRGPDQSR